MRLVGKVSQIHVSRYMIPMERRFIQWEDTIQRDHRGEAVTMDAGDAAAQHWEELLWLLRPVRTQEVKLFTLKPVASVSESPMPGGAITACPASSIGLRSTARWPRFCR